MSSDKGSDPIIVNGKSSGSSSGKTPDDFTKIMLDIGSHIQFKFLGLIFIVFLFLSSDIFINYGLARFDGAVEGRSPAFSGVIIQGIVLVVSMVIINILIAQEII